MARPSTPLQPQKTPVQARSAHTLKAIQTACIQVLIDGGMDQLSTTRAAARAGVSVGSRYQYYANKQSLLAAVLEKHVLHVVETVEAACLRVKGQPVAAMAEALVKAFIAAKFAEPAASRALYAVASKIQGEAVVARLTQRSQVALYDMLALRLMGGLPIWRSSASSCRRRWSDPFRACLHRRHRDRSSTGSRTT